MQNSQLSSSWRRIVGATEMILQHIEAETKWPPISWRQFQMHFSEWKYKISPEFVPTGRINNVPADDFEAIRRQAIIWTNNG